MEKKNLEENVVEKEAKTGEDLLNEYYGQDKDDKHHMGYTIHGQTHSDGCC